MSRRGIHTRRSSLFLRSTATTRPSLNTQKRYFARGGNPDKDYYAILGILKTADKKDIRKAYLNLTKKWHPDTHATADKETRENAKRKFQEIQEAYQILSDDEERNAYDMLRDNVFAGRYRQGTPNYPGRGGYNPRREDFEQRWRQGNDFSRQYRDFMEQEFRRMQNDRAYGNEWGGGQRVGLFDFYVRFFLYTFMFFMGLRLLRFVFGGGRPYYDEEAYAASQRYDPRFPPPPPRRGYRFPDDSQPPPDYPYGGRSQREAEFIRELKRRTGEAKSPTQSRSYSDVPRRAPASKYPPPPPPKRRRGTDVGETAQERQVRDLFSNDTESGIPESSISFDDDESNLRRGRKGPRY